MSPVDVFNAIPQPVKEICVNVTGKLLAGVIASAWKSVAKKDLAPAFARIYKDWSEKLPGEDPRVREAFADFFGREITRKELEKILLDRYREVDFERLELELRVSCRIHGCEPPETDLYQLLDMWVLDLQALLKNSPHYFEKYQTPIENAIRDLDQREAVINNYSLAKSLYLKAVARLHQYIRFTGMAEVTGRPEVEMERVFVMPRVIRQREFGSRLREEPKPFSAHQLLLGTRSAKRAVVLGAPGSGKTTLCECLVLALADRRAGRFPWAADLPDLVPVFYRIRDLDKDLANHSKANIWDCIHNRYSRLVGRDLPAGFFLQLMKSTGLLVLFDGLDEAGSPSRRKDIVDMVSGFADSLLPDSRAIITSRPHDYARQRFTPDKYTHFDLCEFSDEEIQQFIRAWGLTHEPDRALAIERASKLWRALEARPDIKPLARNALLLMMMVRVHFSLVELPDSRLDLYAKCVETLLKHWAEAKDLPPGPLDRYQKERFLGQLAYGLQSAYPEEMKSAGVALQIGRRDLARVLEGFLKAEAPGASTDDVIERLHARDAVLVSYGSDQFGFVHRSFQEYFAAWWMAQWEEEDTFERVVLEEPPGWSETLYMAVAQLGAKRRQNTLLKLLKQNRIELALACVQTAPQIDPWLKILVQFLSKYYREGQEYERLSASECAERCAARRETIAVLASVFDRENRDGRSLAASVELAEELAGLGLDEAQELLRSFSLESERFGLRSVDKMAFVDGFNIDKYIVTNRDFEFMVPSHRGLRDSHSDTDEQPAIYVNWFEASLYCRWRGPGFRLPTEEEWFNAAAWDSVRRIHSKYPWGDVFDSSRCNTLVAGPGKTTRVDAYPHGASPYGCYDMAGNVWEWTTSLWSERGHFRVLRGGAWYHYQDYAASAFRHYAHPRDRSNLVGFRCAISSDG